MNIIKSAVMVLLVAGLLHGCASLGSMASDAKITSLINTEFLQDDMVSAIGINVDTHKGQVTLKGTVDNQAVARRAYDLAYSVEGVSQVISKLTIRSDPMSPWGPVGR